MWDYSDKVKEHFLAPKNVGAIEDADGVGEVGSLACGDALKLYIKLGQDGRIADASFQTFGCASAIASSSALTEIIKGKTLEEAMEISNQDIADYLGGLPKEKMHCSVMGREALEAAIKNLRGEKAPVEIEPEGELVCKCFGVTDKQILRAIRENGLKTAEDVTYFTKAGGGCGDCLPRIEELLAEAQGKGLVPLVVAPAMTNLKRMQLVQKTLDEEIRPRLQADGGDIELVDLDRHTVFVSLRGGCSNCPSSQLTLTHVVESVLREKVDPEIVVKEVKA